MTKPLDEIVDLTPRMDYPHLTTRGAVYKAMINLGESDFIAGSHAFNTLPATRKGDVLTVDEVELFYTDGPAALAERA